MQCTACGHLNDGESCFCGSCGAKLEEASPFSIGGLVAGGRYRIDAQLGEGGMGTVWRATDVMLDRTVALKCLAAELTAHPTARRRMEQEARVLARVQSPNVVQVRNVFEEADILTLELEYVSGGDLEGRVSPGGLADSAVLDLAVKTLNGLKAIHAAGLVHRDIKPANVLLDEAGQPKITDLGVAHDPKAREKTRLGTSLGTPDYMSPEQVRGEAVDARSDVYAMGVMVYQLLCGELPFSGTSEFDIASAHVREAPDLGRLARTSKPETVAWVARALAKSPGDRWQSADEMAKAAQQILSGGAQAGATVAAAPQAPAPAPQPAPAAPRPEPPTPAPAPPAAPAPAKKSGGAGVMIAVLALLMVLGGGALAAVFVLGGNDDAGSSEAAQEQTAAAKPADDAPPVKTAAAQVEPEAPPAPKPPPALIPKLKRGDRWRFRYQKLPRDRDDLWRTRDHVIDRTVESVTPIEGGIAVKIREEGGPADRQIRRFTEVYNAEGIGAQTNSGLVISAPWTEDQSNNTDISVALPAGDVVRLGEAGKRYWVHPTLGKIAEHTVQGRRKDTYILTLIGYSVGGERRGDIEGEPLKCVWSGRTKWLNRGDSHRLALGGHGHKYITAVAQRGAWIDAMSSELLSTFAFSGFGVRKQTVGFGLGSLLVAKTWITPSHGEWVAALWHSQSKTSLTVTHLEGSTLKNFKIRLQTQVTDQRLLHKKHSLLILQRGNTCVVGIKAVGPQGRKAVMVRVQDNGQPTILGGDWPRAR